MIAIVSAVLVGVLGLLAVGAFAQGGRNDGWGRPWTRGARHGHWGPSPEQVIEHRAELAADLGRQLDKAPAEVEAAFRAVVKQHLDEAVAAQRITQQEADQALAAYDDGELHGLFRVFKHHAASDMMDA